jgi:sugar phosphate isomerase/epimerase
LQIKYCCTYWGAEKEKPKAFIDKVLSAGYEGIEIFLPPPTDHFTERFIEEIGVVLNFTELLTYQPTFINSHTGKDYYSFDDNCKVIEAVLNICHKSGVRILHETHRGRFSFHAASLVPYLKKFPELELVGDFSHFCTVSESMLDGQEEIIQQIIPHVSHIHARVGHEQAPQVNNPFAPEWENHFTLFEKWWQQIIDHRKENSSKNFSITPEFGPAPYMPSMPFTQQPLGNQWEINYNMMQRLKATLQT